MGRSKVDEEVRTCGENRIPDCRDSVVLGTETPQGELFFTNAAEQFDAGDGGSCAIKVLKAEHRTCSGFNTPVILFDQIVQVFRRSQLGVIPCLVFPWHLAHCSLRCSVAIQLNTDRRALLGTKRLAEKRFGCRDVSGRAESEVDGVAIPVYGTIQVNPSPSIPMLNMGDGIGRHAIEILINCARFPDSLKATRTGRWSQVRGGLKLRLTRHAR